MGWLHSALLVYLFGTLFVSASLILFIESIGKGLQKAKTAAIMRVPSKAIGRLISILNKHVCNVTFQTYNMHKIINILSIAASPISCNILQQHTLETKQSTGFLHLLQQQEERPSAANKQ
jgi:hypothetical protein